MTDTEHGACLYDLTGNILDINTMLVNRGELRRLLPWRQKLRIRWRNFKRFKKFWLNMYG